MNDSPGGAAERALLFYVLLFCLLIAPPDAPSVPLSMSAAMQDSQLGRYAAGEMRKARTAAIERRPTAGAPRRIARPTRGQITKSAAAFGAPRANPLVPRAAVMPRAMRRSLRAPRSVGNVPTAASSARIRSERILHRAPLAAAAVEAEAIFRCRMAGVRIILDDRYLGATDERGYLVARATRGAHEATFARENYLTVVRRIEVTSGQNIFEIELIPAKKPDSVVPEK